MLIAKCHIAKEWAHTEISEMNFWSNKNSIYVLAASLSRPAGEEANVLYPSWSCDLASYCREQGNEKSEEQKIQGRPRLVSIKMGLEFKDTQ